MSAGRRSEGESPPSPKKKCTGTSQEQKDTNDEIRCQDWHIDSWRSKVASQNPFTGDCDEQMRLVENKLRILPGLVHRKEIDTLREQLADAGDGKKFVLQGGDCAESFADCQGEVLETKLKILIQMSLIIQWLARVPTIRIGRMAGQYAKPRSKDTETLGDGREVKTFRGDSVNEAAEDKREPNPRKLIDAYFHSAATLNFIRGLLANGFGDLRESREWQLHNFVDEERRREYEQVVSQLMDSVLFYDSCGVRLGERASTIDFFTSHEALILPYEAALTRSFEAPSGRTHYYNTSAHFLWIGDRTRQLDGAHIEYIRGVQNPVGIKVGPTAEPATIASLCEKLNPTKEKGKVVLITRLGHARVKETLPPFIDAVKKSGNPVVWICDPMHGNTEVLESKIKTRKFDNVLQEVLDTIVTHRRCGSQFGGVHFEMTGEDVTECTGGPERLCNADLHRRYSTTCDPRLNYSQSLEIAFQLANRLK